MANQNPSDFNVNGYRRLKPVAKLPRFPEHRNTPTPESNGVAQSLFPPLRFRDKRLEG
ncbi:MAG: hypothetical protein ACLPV8_02015 [Steroidobacteraceae bacterium]